MLTLMWRASRQPNEWGKKFGARNEIDIDLSCARKIRALAPCKTFARFVECLTLPPISLCCKKRLQRCAVADITQW